MVTPEKLKVAFVVPALRPNNHPVEWYLASEHDPSYRILLVLSEFMKFDFEIVSDNIVGKMLPNGSWMGVVGMLDRLEVDMAGNALLVNEERSQVYHSAYPFRFYPTTFVIERPVSSPDIYGIGEVFSASSWTTLALLATAVSIVLFASMKRKYSLGDIFLNVLAICVRQKATVRPWTTFQNALMYIWVAGAVFLGFCYTSVLLSFLTVPSTHQIKNMRDLSDAVENDGYKCFYDSFLTNGPPMLVKSDSEPSVTVGRDVLDNPNRFVKIDDFLRMRKEKVAFFGLEESVPHLPDKYFVSEDSVLDVLCALAVRKDFCCKERLDDAVHRLMASGLYAKVKNDKNFLSGLKFGASVEGTCELTLTLPDFYLAFVILLFGYFLSFVVLCVEIMVAHRQK